MRAVTRVANRHDRLATGRERMWSADLQRIATAHELGSLAIEVDGLHVERSRAVQGNRRDAGVEWDHGVAHRSVKELLLIVDHQVERDVNQVIITFRLL